jgi:hypothetical protein
MRTAYGRFSPRANRYRNQRCFPGDAPYSAGESPSLVVEIFRCWALLALWFLTYRLVTFIRDLPGRSLTLSLSLSCTVLWCFPQRGMMSQRFSRPRLT